MIAALLCAYVLVPPASEPPLTVRVDAGLGVELQQLQPGPWDVPPAMAGAFAVEPRLALGRWHLGMPVGYRSSVRATLVERAPGTTRPVRIDTFEGSLRGEREWRRGLWTFEIGASIWGGRWRLAAPRPGRLPDATTGVLRAGVPMRLQRGRVQATLDTGLGIGVGTDNLGRLWGARADVRVRTYGPLIAVVRMFHDGWLFERSARTGVTLTAGLGLEVPGLARAASTVQRALSPEPPAPASTPSQARTPAPPLKGATLAGEALELSTLKGSVVVVDFWASWCGPCRGAMPKLEALHESWAEQDVVVLGVSMDEDAADARGFMLEAGVTFESVHDASGSIAQQWAPPKMPTTYVIDRQGRIAYVHAGVHDGDEGALKREVESLLAEGP